jgi:hypothetical protein
MQLVEQFEKSRWMLFCFWPGKLEDLIEMELQLMDNVMEQDDLICGNMRTRIPKLYGLQSVDELKKMVCEQYEKTTFSLNETEIQFIRYRQNRLNIGTVSVLKNSSYLRPCGTMITTYIYR